MMINKLSLLNEEYYKAFARLKKNREFLTDKQYSIMGNMLISEYQKALKLLCLEADIEYKSNVFKLKERVKREVPSGFLFFKNREAKLMKKMIERDYNLFIKIKENHLKKDLKNDD